MDDAAGETYIIEGDPTPATRFRVNDIDGYLTTDEGSQGGLRDFHLSNAHAATSESLSVKESTGVVIADDDAGPTISGGRGQDFSFGSRGDIRIPVTSHGVQRDGTRSKHEGTGADPEDVGRIIRVTRTVMADVATAIPIDVGTVSGVTEPIATTWDRRLILSKRHPGATIPVAVGPARQIAAVEVLENCTWRGSLFRRNRVADGDGLVVDLVEDEREVGSDRRGDAITDRELNDERAVEVGGADERVDARGGGDGDRTGLDASGLVDVDARREINRGDGRSGCVLMDEARDDRGRRQSVERDIGVLILAAREQVAGDGARFVDGLRRLGGGGRTIVDRGDREGELARGGGSARAAIQDRVGDLDRAVVVGGTRESITAIGSHRQRTRDDVGRRTALTGVDRGGGIADEELASGALIIRDIGELRDREGRRRGVSGGEAVGVEVIGQDIARDRRGFVDVIGIVYGRRGVICSGNRQGEVRASAGGVAVAGNILQDERAVPVGATCEVVSAVGDVDGDGPGLIVARLAILASHVDIDRLGEVGQEQLRTVRAEVVELLDHDGGRRCVQGEALVDVSVVGNQAAADDRRFIAGASIGHASGRVVDRGIGQGDRLASGLGGRAIRATGAIVADVDDERVVDVVIGERGVGQRGQGGVDRGLGARELDGGVAILGAGRESQTRDVAERERTPRDRQVHRERRILLLDGIQVGDADVSDRLGDILGDRVGGVGCDGRGVVHLYDVEVDRVGARQQAVGDDVADLREAAVDRVKVVNQGHGDVTARRDRDIADQGDGDGLARILGDPTDRERGNRQVVAVDVIDGLNGAAANQLGATDEVTCGRAPFIEGQGDGIRRRTVVGADRREGGAGRAVRIDGRVVDLGQACFGDATEVVRVRREDKGAVGTDQERAAGREGVGGADHKRPRFTDDAVRLDGEVGTIFDVRIVREQVTRQDGALGRFERGFIDDGRDVIVRGDGDVQVARLGQGPIGDRVGDDRNGAVPVGERREGVGAVGVDDQGALVRDAGRSRARGRDIVDRHVAVDGELGDGKLGVRVIDVAVVRQDVAAGDIVFIRRTRVVHRDRGVVDRIDGDDEGIGDRRGSRRAAVGALELGITVGRREGDRVEGAVPIGGRREGVGAGGRDRQRTLAADCGGGGAGGGHVIDRVVARDGELRDRDGLIFDFRRAREDVARDDRIFITRGRGVTDTRGVVDGFHPDVQGAGRGRETIRDGELDGREGAIPVGINRRERIGPVRIHLERTLTGDDDVRSEGLRNAIDLQGARDDGKRLVGVIVRIIGVDRGINDRARKRARAFADAGGLVSHARRRVDDDGDIRSRSTAALDRRLVAHRVDNGTDGTAEAR